MASPSTKPSSRGYFSKIRSVNRIRPDMGVPSSGDPSMTAAAGYLDLDDQKFMMTQHGLEKMVPDVMTRAMHLDKVVFHGTVHVHIHELVGLEDIGLAGTGVKCCGCGCGCVCGAKEDHVGFIPDTYMEVYVDKLKITQLGVVKGGNVELVAERDRRKKEQKENKKKELEDKVLQAAVQEQTERDERKKESEIEIGMEKETERCNQQSHDTGVPKVDGDSDDECSSGLAINSQRSEDEDEYLDENATIPTIRPDGKLKKKFKTLLLPKKNEDEIFASKSHILVDKKFHFDVCTMAQQLRFELIVTKAGIIDREYIVGSVRIKIEDLVSNKLQGRCFYPVFGTTERLRNARSAAQLADMTIGFTPAAVLINPVYYFPTRDNCYVEFYHDAHITKAQREATAKIFPNVDGKGNPYVDRSCWIDLYRSIQDAQHFIYICGWSVDCDIKLIRQDSENTEPVPTLGQMLVDKANEGVKVCVMIWDEVLSGKVFSGIMGTSDEKTYEFFKKTKVVCRKAVRASDETAKGLIAKLKVSVNFTHHQKCVILDQPLKNNKSSIQSSVVAFVGGLDLTGGRFDMPTHPLFRSLQSYHKDDWYSNNYKSTDPAFGPREPWHDIHCKVDGEIALDVRENFEARWLCQCPDHSDALYTLPESIFGTAHERARLAARNPRYNFRVRLLRSIDERSVIIDHDRPGLMLKKGRRIDNSIHREYVYRIRHAQRFIYIENQYFIGSSQFWLTENATYKASNIVPVEIAQRIVNQILNDKPFVAYIAIPLHAEGVTDTAPLQEILRFQYYTIEFMYRIVGAALKEKNSKKHPKDYLKFFFLGNRETAQGAEQARTRPKNDFEGQMESVRRSSIYIHSKMMIVDDEHIIIGSANINQRSMDGARDSEIAIVATQKQATLQPVYMNLHPDSSATAVPLSVSATSPTSVTSDRCSLTSDARDSVSGSSSQVGNFRKVLWLEHMGTYESVFDRPESAECAARVDQIAETNWAKYTADEITDMDHGHLISYPYTIEKSGKITPRIKTFWETDGKVKGSSKWLIPDLMTT